MPLFGTSGIRGVVGQEITTQLCHEVAEALGATLPVGSRVCLATDTRASGEMLKEAVFSGLLSCGMEITDLSILPTPVLALLTREWGFETGIMITASHNPPEFNGIKLFNRNAVGYSWDQEQQIEEIYRRKAFRRGYRGSLDRGSGMEESYLQFIRHALHAEVLHSDMRIVVDPGNGAASGFVSSLFAEMGLKVIPLNDSPNGLFGGRKPEPTEDTLRGTVEFLKAVDADMAVCFDGDADRVVFCDREGFLGFNEPTAFVSRLVAEGSGKKRVASTVEAGRLLDYAVGDLGVEVVRGKVGDVPLAYLTRQIDAAIGTEQVGVYIIPQIGYYPDSIFAALTLIKRLRKVSQIRDFLREMPRLFFEKSKVSCPNQLKQMVMKSVGQEACHFGADGVNELDGIRLEFADSWMLIRASGTEPVIRIIAEATSPSRVGELLEKGVQTVRYLVEENN